MQGRWERREFERVWYVGFWCDLILTQYCDNCVCYNGCRVKAIEGKKLPACFVVVHEVGCAAKLDWLSVWIKKQHVDANDALATFFV